MSSSNQGWYYEGKVAEMIREFTGIDIMGAEREVAAKVIYETLQSLKDSKEQADYGPLYDSRRKNDE